MGWFRSRFASAVVLAIPLITPAGVVAQSGAAPPADTAKKPDPPPPPLNHLETTWEGFKLTGFAQG